LGLLVLIPATCLPLFSQQNTAAPLKSSPVPSAAKAPPPQGLQAPWDLRQMLAALNAQNEKMKPLLDAMHPRQWLDNGAPSAYVSQYQDARTQMDNVIISVKNLGAQPESLSAALDTYFRMESLEISVRSVYDCVRKYGDRPAADQLNQLLAQNFDNRRKFRDYLRDLSTQRETECKVADEEAQRCRGMISREPPPSSGTRKTHK
jgi:hypothetical protein